MMNTKFYEQYCKLLQKFNKIEEIADQFFHYSQMVFIVTMVLVFGTYLQPIRKILLLVIIISGVIFLIITIMVIIQQHILNYYARKHNKEYRREKATLKQIK